jgi:hypothetical protein
VSWVQLRGCVRHEVLKRLKIDICTNYVCMSNQYLY